jgi:predicted nucleic acid-binding protein
MSHDYCAHIFRGNRMNVTFSIDKRVAEQARRAAQAMGKSLNQAVRDYLSSWPAAANSNPRSPPSSNRRRARLAAWPAGPSIARSCSAVRSFIDTNVLVYADSADAADNQARATALVAEHRHEGGRVISTQALHEFVNAAIRNLDLPVEIVRARVRLYSHFETVNASAAAVHDALDLHALHQVSFRDALIVQAARQSGCVQLPIDDLQAGAVIGGVRSVNPFEEAPKPRGLKRRSPVSRL